MKNEFSRPFRIEKLRGGAVRQSIEADAAERAALAARFDLIALDKLAADLEIRAGAGGTVRVIGHMTGAATQSCVVTLEPVPAPLDMRFEMAFAEDAAPDEIGGIVVDMDAEDPPEPIENGSIDLGEAVVQQMAVTLDPYPRAAGVPLPPEAAERPAGRESPFAALLRKS